MIPLGAEGSDAGSTLNPAHGVALTPLGRAGSALYRLAAGGASESSAQGSASSSSVAALALASDHRTRVGALTLSGAHFHVAGQGRRDAAAAEAPHSTTLAQATWRPAHRVALALTASRASAPEACGAEQALGCALAGVLGESLTLSVWAALHARHGSEWALALAPAPAAASPAPKWGAVMGRPIGGGPTQLEAFLVCGGTASAHQGWSATPGVCITAAGDARAVLHTQLKF